MIIPDSVCLFVYHVSELFCPDCFYNVPLPLAAAKEKREKSPALKQSGLPPRPHTRRGRSGTAGDLGLDSLAGLRPQAVLMRSRLRHAQLPGELH